MAREKSSGQLYSSTDVPSEMSGRFHLSDYFHAELRREFVEDRLQKEGDFLVRFNADNTSYVISVRWQDQIQHILPRSRVTRSGHQVYNFGFAEFDSVEKLVAHHLKNGVCLSDSLETMLLCPIKAPKTVYYEEDLEIRDKLGGGAFGEVYRTFIKSEDIEVAMKMLKGDVSKKERLAFEKEMNMMKSMSHEHIVKLIGVVKPRNAHDHSIKILLELINKGSLDKLLSRGKVTDRGKLKICVQVAKGMSYLHLLNIIHRDLAARNILIKYEDSGAIIAKVSDFGLSYVDEKGSGFQLKASQRLPLKWLAPECFLSKRWTMASDVWSFGILMWEVYENGREPYTRPGDPQTAKEVSAFVSSGGHPQRPPKLKSEEVFGVMHSCWRKDADQRPTMRQVEGNLLDHYNRGKSGRTCA